MLAGRELPPIVRPPPPPPSSPVATFFHVPRRYVRSNMQVGDTPQNSSIDDVKRSRNVRKSNRIHDAKSTPTSSPVQRAKEEFPSPVLTSPRSIRERLAPLEGTVNGDDRVGCNSPSDIRSPPSATSTGSGELSQHVCLCQPEPKIPRPRNGKLAALFVFKSVQFQRIMWQVTGQRTHSLLVYGFPQPLTSL
jgi:hypothetical protein